MQPEMSVIEAADYLQISRDYVRWLVMKGKLLRTRQINKRAYLLDTGSIVAFDQQKRAKKGKK